jgi:hypothetical protein
MPLKKQKLQNNDHPSNNNYTKKPKYVVSVLIRGDITYKNFEIWKSNISKLRDYILLLSDYQSDSTHIIVPDNCSRESLLKWSKNNISIPTKARILSPTNDNINITHGDDLDTQFLNDVSIRNNNAGGSSLQMRKPHTDDTNREDGSSPLLTNTDFLTLDVCDSAVEEHMVNEPISPRIMSKRWLIESLRRGHVVSEDDYVVNFSTKTEYDNNQSVIGRQEVLPAECAQNQSDNALKRKTIDHPNDVSKKLKQINPSKFAFMACVKATVSSTSHRNEDDRIAGSTTEVSGTALSSPSNSNNQMDHDSEPMNYNRHITDVLSRLQHVYELLKDDYRALGYKKSIAILSKLPMITESSEVRNIRGKATRRLEMSLYQSNHLVSWRHW